MIITLFYSSEITQFNYLHIQIIEFKCNNSSGGEVEVEGRLVLLLSLHAKYQK